MQCIPPDQLVALRAYSLLFVCRLCFVGSPLLQHLSKAIHQQQRTRLEAELESNPVPVIESNVLKACTMRSIREQRRALLLYDLLLFPVPCDTAVDIPGSTRICTIKYRVYRSGLSLHGRNSTVDSMSWQYYGLQTVR